MNPQLEARRLAIADALREAMAEPLPEPVALPEPTPLPERIEVAADAVGSASIQFFPPFPAPAPLTLVRNPLPELFEPEPVDVAEEPAPIDPDDADGTTPAVPPVEPIGQMSPAAAMALFGHH